MKKLYGVIPAAGRGVRAWPESLVTPKCMFTIHGIPLLQRNIELMRDQMGICEIVIITGYLGSVIEEYFGNGSRWGMQFHFIKNMNLDLGLAWSVFLSREWVDNYFCVILGDEYYQGSNHQQLATVDYRQKLATCAVKKGAQPAVIKENYSVQLSGSGAIYRLVEKPVHPGNDLLGCGTFVLSPAIFSFLEEAYRGKESSVDFISLLDILCQQGHPLEPFWLEGLYVNINDRNGLDRAALLDASCGAN
ncbi:MAG: nucleotidyltransferase family protein [Desulfocapsa sp.]|nr:nucleotidyltransferase family protein [Desulfocapsa sp.]